jgi:NAD+ synthase (glutamine-hydrolysing)
MWTGEKNGASSGYETDPVAELCEKGATVMINISASPFSAGKDRLRYEIIRSHAKRCAIPFLFVNQTGANDELIFDGRSMALDAEGRPLAVLPAFKESIETIEVPSKPIADTYAPMDETASVHEALVTGLRDYMHKNSFKKAVLGLSGGIDSAVTAAIACEAAGKGNILGVSMPSAFSSDESLEYSRMLADNLGMDFKNIPISEVYDVYLKVLVGNGLVERGDEVSVTLQNIQSRIRGNILMAYSNESGYLLLSTGNKSEMAVGYCTLYGDMAGGLAVLSDVPKTMVYSLADHINRETEIIPQEIVDRAPTAELRPGQLDSQALPPYPVLDRILYLYIHEKLAAGDIAAEGFGRETVDWVIKSVNRNEYKRRQAPPGLKVTSKAFGSGRRMPVSAKFIWE